MPKTEAETPLYEPIASDGTPEKGAGCVPLLAQHKKKALAVALGVACTIGVVVAVAMPHKSTGDAGGSHAPSSGPCGGATCLPTHSSCSKICPGCDTLPCDCPPVDGHAACWPGSGLHNTPDHGCNCECDNHRGIPATHLTNTTVVITRRLRPAGLLQKWNQARVQAGRRMSLVLARRQPRLRLLRVAGLLRPRNGRSAVWHSRGFRQLRAGALLGPTGSPTRRAGAADEP
jgi:hypothetical protein